SPISSRVNSASTARARRSRLVPGASLTAARASGATGGSAGGPGSPQAAKRRAGSTAARKLGGAARGIGALLFQAPDHGNRKAKQSGPAPFLARDRPRPAVVRGRPRLDLSRPD